MVREIKASPMLFGYRGCEMVDVAPVEQLILRVAQLQNDLPQVSALDLPLVLAGADGCLGAERRGPGRPGGRRRAPTGSPAGCPRGGGHQPGLTALTPALAA